MKHLLRVIFIVIMFNITSYSFGQYSPIPIEYKLDESQLVIQGEVIFKQSYRGNDNIIYTENTIEVDMVLQGVTSQSKISVITMGGTLDGQVTTWSHLPSFSIGDYGAFFLNPSERPRLENTSFLAFDVFSGNQGFYHIREEISGYSATATLDSYDNINNFYSKIGFTNNVNNVKFNQNNILNSDSCLIYKIEFVNSGKESATLYFNIFLRVSSDEFRLNQTELYLNYSTDWFYSNMISNEHLTYTSGDFNDEIYDLSVSDQDTNTLHIILQSNSTNYQNLETINSTYKLVATFGVDLKSYSSDPPLSEEFSDVTNNYRTQKGELMEFACVGSELESNCGMEITSMTEIAAAGVGFESENGIPGIVVIEGKNFLNDNAVFDCGKPRDHHVKFNTIDGDWIAPLEGDYLEYTDTKIRVKVPTKGYKDNSNIMYSNDEINEAVACTGKVRVCRRDNFVGINCGCFVTSDNDLYVPFAARNDFTFNDNSCKESVKYILQDLDGNGGYTWRFDDSFKNIPGSVDAFKRALTTWRCATKINFKVDEINPPTVADGICTVKMGTLAVGTRATNMFTLIVDCADSDNRHPGRMELTYNSTMNWHTGTDMPSDLNWDDVSGGSKLQGDMESSGLHELGHGHLLLHTCNAANVMVSPGPNNFRRDITIDDLDGGIHESILGNVNSNCRENMELIDISDCNITSIININGEEANVEIYPNPADNIVFIEFSSILSDHKLMIELLDSYGRHLSSRELYDNDLCLNFDISQYPTGIYYIGFWDTEGEYSIIGKILKAK